MAVDHKKQIQIITFSDKPLSDKAKEIVEYFETVEAENIYFSFNTSRTTDEQVCTVTISYSLGNTETFSVNF